MKNRANFAIAALAGLGILLTGVTISPAWAVPSYPSAAEVAAAKKSVTEKKAMITRIEGILDGLQAEADALEAIAISKTKQYTKALKAVDEMAAKVEALAAKAVDADLEAQAAERQIGQIGAQMYRQGTSGDTTLELFFNPEGSDQLLYQLGTAQMIAQRTDAIYKAALDKKAQALELSNELASSQAELEDRKVAAKKLADEAKAAANAVISKVNASERERATMMDQLDSLQDNAAELAKQRADGLEAERRQNLVKTAPTAPELYSVGPPNTALVESAIAFAYEQLGERYVLGGAGPNVWDCSGITMKAYAEVGIYIGWHSATAQFNIMAANQKLVPFQDIQRGDLIWWTRSSNFSGDKYHTAIYLGDGMMLEAPNPARTVRVVPVRYGELFPYAARPSA